jgi:SAM-dependent methyltransferase
MPKASSALASLPAAYQAWRASELGRITDANEERLLLELVGSVSGKRVLDVGCGDGVLSVHLAQAGGIVVGLDTDQRVLAAARERARISQAAADFVEGDARSLPFDDSSFDVVVAVTVLCFVADSERAVKEMARVLRPGGRLVLGELGRISLWAVKRRLSGWLGSLIWRNARFRTVSELRRLVVAAHLEVADVRGAIYYPPCNLCARWLAPLEPYLARASTLGAAFIAVSARKPA